MRKSFDKSSGAIVFTHTKDELEQAQLLREAKKTKKTLTALCKVLNIKEEDLEAAMAEENEE